jgi:hypothetical protein
MTFRHSQRRSGVFAFTLFGVLGSACSGGGGGGTPPSEVVAEIPAGTGKLAIQMAGTWLIQGAAVVETNSPNPEAPVNGTPIVLDGTGIVSIAGLSVARADLEALLGTTLTFYVNRADGRTVVYGLGTDRFAQGGPRELAGVAGGSFNDNTIAVETYTSRQQDAASPEIFVRSRYMLTRVDSSAPAGLAPDSSAEGEARLRTAIQTMFGREGSPR